jgi:hypothetical protein
VVVVALCLVFFFLILPMLRRRSALRAAAAGGAPEIVIPEVVNAEYRTFEAEGKRALPWRLALPQAPQTRGPKGLSAEDQARLKVIIDFAKSLPLPEPSSDAKWLVDLAENSSGSTASPELYSQILTGAAQLHYEPAWMHHPTFVDLQTLLEGQPILQDLNAFVDSVNRAASESGLLIQDIYRDTTAEISGEIQPNSGWEFCSAVYVDSLAWFLGKYLREPSDRDYSIKPEGQAEEGQSAFGLYGEPSSPFAGLLIKAPGEKEAADYRALHLKLRRNYRSNDRSRDIVAMITQLQVQRSRLLGAFNQFNRLNA